METPLPAPQSSSKNDLKSDEQIPPAFPPVGGTGKAEAVTAEALAQKVALGKGFVLVSPALPPLAGHSWKHTAFQV